jgi:hypothetical protein
MKTRLWPFCLLIFANGGWVCGSSEGDPGSTVPSTQCPQAQELYDHSQTLYDNLLEAIPFGSKWKIDLRYRKVEKVRIAKGAPPFSPNLTFRGEREYKSETTIDFQVPAMPSPIPCDQIANLAAYSGIGNSEELKEAVMGLYLMKLMEMMNYTVGLVAPASGTHSSRIDPSYTQDDVIVGFCSYPNPCSNHRDEHTGCTAVPETHNYAETLVLEWEGGKESKLGFAGDSDAITLGGENRTQDHSYNEIDWKSEVSSDLCKAKYPVCAGRETETIECGLGFLTPCFDELSIPFKKGTQVACDKDGDLGSSRTEVTMVCTSGCECKDKSQCDDGKECTKDECIGGNCKNTADDTITPEQVDRDCRTCKNGEVVSFRDQVESECAQIRDSTLADCAKGGANWLVHWIESMAGVEDEGYFCVDGPVPDMGDVTFCEGAGKCTTGQKDSSLQGSIDKICTRPDNGTAYQFACDVFCAFCS